MLPFWRHSAVPVSPFVDLFVPASPSLYGRQTDLWRFIPRTAAPVCDNPLVKPPTIGPWARPCGHAAFALTSAVGRPAWPVCGFEPGRELANDQQTIAGFISLTSPKAHGLGPFDGFRQTLQTPVGGHLRPGLTPLPHSRWMIPLTPRERENCQSRAHFFAPRLPSPLYTLRTCVCGRTPNSGRRAVRGRQRNIFCMGRPKALCATHREYPPNSPPIPGD